VLIRLEPADTGRLLLLSGLARQNLTLIEQYFGVEISDRGNQFNIHGEEERSVRQAGKLLEQLYQETAEKNTVDAHHVHLLLQEMTGAEMPTAVVHNPPREIVIRTRNRVIKPRGENQYNYMDNILRHDVSFGVGPAGTGKTYLAVACAVEALNNQEIKRLVLVRPAVEAGEKLGFLPGDMADKIDPYLRPLYDALYEMLGFERVAKYIERSIIEVAPLAFMRGRTLNDSFIILDEAQNTTREQMKMFLTRLGFGSKAVITGDITQIDLPGHITSGLTDATQVLGNVEGIHFTQFTARDVVRHQLVQKIVQAYDAAP
jgi:phosphate starvation-inducible protein PhoH and related proteins